MRRLNTSFTTEVSARTFALARVTAWMQDVIHPMISLQGAQSLFTEICKELDHKN